MNIFELVKDAVPTWQAATHYGLTVTRNHMTCCPFHNDRHPSMKLNDSYIVTIIASVVELPET